ncbi:MAG: hypothetical protein WCI30_06960 [Clostridia bacterium]
MESLQHQFISSNISRFRILVNNTADYNISGILYNEYYQLTMSFQGIREFFSSLEQFFDSVNFPQHTHQHRSFGAPSDKEKVVPIPLQKGIHSPKTGKKATFTMHVQFRQNATWQGTLQWLEGKQTERFRSELEMLKLMINAIDFSNENDGLVDWE